jgi:hypothetical protein
MKGSRDGVQVVIEEACIGVERHRGGGVAEHPLNGFHVRAGRDGEAGRRVPEIVDGQRRREGVVLCGGALAGSV